MKSSIEFISASAGSGKTYRLVEVVSEAIGNQTCRPQGLIATTFTVAAANELKERMTEKLYAAENHEAAALLDAGLIGTMHSVCLAILKKFPLEAGLSPDLKILDTSQSALLLSQAFDRVLSQNHNMDLYYLADRLGQYNPQYQSYQWQGDIKSIVENARSNDIPPSKFHEMAEASWHEMREALPTPTDEDLDAILVSAIKQALQKLDPTPSQKNARVCLAALKSGLADLEAKKANWYTWESLRSLSPAAAEKESVSIVKEVAERWGEHPEFMKELKKYLFLVFEVAEELAHEFEQLKLQAGSADFADLEKITLDLLRSNPEIRESLAASTDLLIVDEFQDTSPIQLALFSQLADCADRVVWVGDVKQAIYGFRNADPTLIEAAVKHAEKSDSLGTSWRSLPDLVGFTNELFTDPFHKKLGLPDKEVQLTPHRKTPPHASPALIFAALSSGGYTKENKLKKLVNKDRYSCTADAIIDFLHSGAEVTDSSSVTLEDPIGKRRPVMPKDIAVLVRKKAHAAAIASELRKRGVDVSLASAGLLSTPECRFAIACLRVLSDPSDSLALAEVISFENEHAPESWLSKRIDYVNSIDKETPYSTWGTTEELKSETISVLVALREDSSTPSLSPLALFRLAIQKTDISRIISAWGPTQERVEQRLANLSALEEFIEQYQSSSADMGLPTSLPGLFSWLEDLADDRNGDSIDKCPVDPEINAVHISTYHVSKGLEWPVVFVADLDEAPRSRLFSVRPHTDSSELDLSNPLRNRSLRLWISPLLKKKSNRVTKLFEASAKGVEALDSAISEDLRLLYVGLTRARDTIVFLHDPVKTPAWLNITEQEVLSTSGNELKLGASTFEIQTKSYEFSEYTATPEAMKSILVPSIVESKTERLPLRINPSSQAPKAEASIRKTIEFGQRMNISGSVNDRDLGDAMHRILAAEIQNPKHSERIKRAHDILAHWSLDEKVTAQEALAAVDRYKTWVSEQFSPSQQLVEVPFTYITSKGQQATGFIDHLLLTPSGPVIIDHKSFQGKRSKWDEKALSYSGQLALYQEVVQSSYPDQPAPTTWIHLLSCGAALELIS